MTLSLLERGVEQGYIGAAGYNPSPGGACMERLCPLGQTDAVLTSPSCQVFQVYSRNRALDPRNQRCTVCKRRVMSRHFITRRPESREGFEAYRLYSVDRVPSCCYPTFWKVNTVLISFATPAVNAPPIYLGMDIGEVC